MATGTNRKVESPSCHLRLIKGGEMEIRIEGNQLIIKSTIGSGVPSSSGRTLVVATTNGFVPVEGSDLRVSLNVIKPRK